MIDEQRWLARLGSLRVDRSTGDPAPHKPLLVLAMLDLAEEGRLPHGKVPLTPELAFRFATYWGIVAERRPQRPDIRLPFHHLSSDGLWSALDRSGEPSDHRAATQMVDLVSGFADFANDPASRDKARRILIATYFTPHERISLYTMVGLQVPDSEQFARDIALGATLDEARGRVARFRVQVTSVYQFTCALTARRLFTIDATSLVQAAHVHAFSDGGSNDIDNGLALSQDSHWSFDEGLWSLTDDYRVMVAIDKYSEEAPEGKLLQQYHGKAIRLPGDRRHWPSVLNIRWHREHVFVGNR
jgi:putative restriction endonuclease